MTLLQKELRLKDEEIASLKAKLASFEPGSTMATVPNEHPQVDVAEKLERYVQEEILARMGEGGLRTIREVKESPELLSGVQATEALRKI